jgi:hypothetical protein
VTIEPTTPTPGTQVQRAIPRDTLGALLAAQQEETGVPPQLLRPDGTAWPVSFSAAAGKSLGEASGTQVAEPPMTGSIQFAKSCGAVASQELIDELMDRPIPSYEGVTFTALDDIPATRQPEPTPDEVEPVGPVEDCDLCPQPAPCDTAIHRLDAAGATFLSLVNNEKDAAFRAARRAVVDKLAPPVTATTRSEPRSEIPEASRRSPHRPRFTWRGWVKTWTPRRWRGDRSGDGAK